MSGVRFVDPRCSCRPGARCEVCRGRHHAHIRFRRIDTVHHVRAGRPSVYQKLDGPDAVR